MSDKTKVLGYRVQLSGEGEEWYAYYLNSSNWYMTAEPPKLLPRPMAVALLRWARKSKAGRGLRLVRVVRKKARP